MPTKVLVFESDSAFASELRAELGKLGCMTTVVDDGNAGLQAAASDRPDLILLSIELPRMNGFSVCNKLKKDAALREVPLIIMSSESSEETFEQHKKLRTRAEDYVHKPIAFGELLQHIQPFVNLSAGDLTDGGGIVVDDEVQIDDSFSQPPPGGSQPRVRAATPGSAPSTRKSTPSPTPRSVASRARPRPSRRPRARRACARRRASGLRP
ncbi:MAG: response regulator [Polyangiaceae bacterium]